MDSILSSYVVLGGSGGIGLSICRKLLQSKVKNLAVLDRQCLSPELLMDFESNYSLTKIDCHQIDVTDVTKLKNLFMHLNDQYPSIDGIINCVGIFNDKNVEQTFQVNTCSVIHTTLIGLKLMGNKPIESKESKVILNIASLVGLEPWHVFPIYTASKHAVVGFTRAMSHDYYYEKYGVRLMVLCPGATDTKFVQQFKDNMIFPDETVAVAALSNVSKQLPDTVADHAMTLLKEGKNGSIWISDNDELRLVNMQSYYNFD